MQISPDTIMVVVQRQDGSFTSVPKVQQTKFGEPPKQQITDDGSWKGYAEMSLSEWQKHCMKPDNKFVDGEFVAGAEIVPDYAELREKAILAEWPINKQLEALTEAREDPPRMEKLDALTAHIAAVKLQYPKPTE